MNFRTFPTLSSQNCPSENTTNYFMDNNFLTMYVVYVGVILSISWKLIFPGISLGNSSVSTFLIQGHQLLLKQPLLP